MIANAFTAAGTVFWFIVFLAIFLIAAVIVVMLVGEVVVHLWRNRQKLKEKFLAKKKHRDAVDLYDAVKERIALLNDEGTRSRASNALEQAFQVEDTDECCAKMRGIQDHANKLISMQNTQSQ